MTKIYSVQKRHYNKLANFLSNFEIEIVTKKEKSDVFWYNRFTLWWDNNPAFNEDLLRGLILDCDGKIEGFYGFIPSFFQLSGEQIIVFNGTTWMVNKKFRGINGLKLIVRMIDYTKDSIYFATSSVGSIAEMHLKFGFKTIFSEERLKTYYVFINPWNIFLQKLPKLLFFRFLLTLFYPIIVLYRLIINLMIETAREYYETRIIEKADGLFDELWDSTKIKFQNTNVRTSEVINWYCSNNGVGNNILFGCYLNNRLLGYMLCMSETENNKLKKLTVMDIWGQIDDDRVVCSLLNKCLKYGVENDYDLVLLPVFHEKIRSFSRKFFFNSRVSSGSYLFKAKEKVLNKIGKEQSYFTYLQGDWGLF
jgi:hypothetical protein